MPSSPEGPEASPQGQSGAGGPEAPLRQRSAGGTRGVPAPAARAKPELPESSSGAGGEDREPHPPPRPPSMTPSYQERRLHRLSSTSELCSANFGRSFGPICPSLLRFHRDVPEPDPYGPPVQTPRRPRLQPQGLRRGAATRRASPGEICCPPGRSPTQDRRRELEKARLAKVAPDTRLHM